MEQTVSQTSFTILLTLTYLNAVSKLYFFREHIVTNFVSAPGRFCKWCCTNPLLLLLLFLFLLLLLVTPLCRDKFMTVFILYS